jgi:hypothetical protein
LLAVVALAAAVAHAFRPEITIDATTLALAAIAVLLIFTGEIHVKTVELLGMKVELEQRSATDNQQAIDTLQEPRPGGVSEPEIKPYQSATANNRRPSDSLDMPRPDNYLAIANKLTPVEAIVSYAIIGPIITAAGLTPEWTLNALWIAFTLFIILTPLYLLYALSPPLDRGAVLQTICGTAIFSSWALLLGGPFLSLSWYRPVYVALLLLCSILILPILVVRNS